MKPPAVTVNTVTAVVTETTAGKTSEQLYSGTVSRP